MFPGSIISWMLLLYYSKLTVVAPTFLALKLDLLYSMLVHSKKLFTVGTVSIIIIIPVWPFFPRACAYGERKRGLVPTVCACSRFS